MLVAVRFDSRQAGIQVSDWTPDPFDVAQGRGEHSRTTIETFEGDDFRKNSHKWFSDSLQVLRRTSISFVA